MRYNYWIHLRNSEGLSFCANNHNVSKTRIHKVIDFYSKQCIIEQLLVQPCLPRSSRNIQNP